MALFGSVNWSATLRQAGTEPALLPGSAVTWRFFDVLGTRPLLGRTFRSDDDTPAAPRRVVISHAAWINRLGADRSIVGRTIDLDGPIEVIGVMPPEFFFPRGADWWMAAGPLLAQTALERMEPVEPLYEGLGVFFGLARLDAGASLSNALAQSPQVVRGIGEEHTVDVSEVTTGMQSLPDHIFGPPRTALIVLMGAVVLVLFVAAINVAGLLLARGAARARETAVRTALGATRWALVRPRFIEAALLAIAGGAAGVSVAAIFLDSLVAMSPADIPRLDTVGLDGTVLAFALALMTGTTLLLGVAPALRLNDRSVADQLRGTSSGIAVRSGTVRSRGVLVALQSGATVVLLVAAGLCIESFARLNRLDLGFDPANLLTFSINGLNDERFPTKTQRDETVERLLARFESTPGVVAAGAVYLRPFQHRSIGMDSNYQLEGQLPTNETIAANGFLNWEAATPGYFPTMGIRLLSGRTFGATDTATSPRVVVVSETMAARAWPGQDPVGKRLRLEGFQEPAGAGNWSTVVGVVANARYREIEKTRFDIYVPLTQSESNVQHYMVRTRVDPAGLVAALRGAASSIHAGLALDGVTTMDAIVRRTRGPWHFNTLVFSLFGGVALGLAALGVFGLVAYAVAQRTREIGVRMALGATRGSVIRLTIAQGFKPAALGLSAGLLVAFYSTRLLSGLLFETSPTDPAAFLRMPLVLVAVTILACAWPARRAATVDPVVVLRQE